MFVDIDFPEAKPAGGFLKKLFGGSAKSDPQADALALVDNWTSQNPGWGWRIYRTKAGMRLLATHALVDADSPEAEAVFEALGSDPLYRKLCKVQKCFRARLTPKPWRCGVNHKPPRWPWADAKAEKWFQTWNTQYESYAFNWGTCQFLRAIGNPAVHAEIQPIVQLHDEKTKAVCETNLA